MQKIPLPSSLKIEPFEENKNQASIIIEPCYPGYGITLGNALRRVLLSSLTGAAVIAVKIKGVHHEFSTIPHIKEDVVDIILNLKQLRLKMLTKEPTLLTLKVSGEKKVTAKDIKASLEVEIVNPQLEIATLTDKKANLEMKIWVKLGQGYVPSEEQEEMNWEIDTIIIDSIFTSVINASLKVENVRVGKRTDFDKLILNIETDGSITPKEAISQAAEILIDQFNFILNPQDKREMKKEEKVKKELEKIIQEKEISKEKPKEVKAKKEKTVKKKEEKEKKTKKEKTKKTK